MLPSCAITCAAVQGTRATLEDRMDVVIQAKDENPYIFAAVYDGHGSDEAAEVAQANMLDIIKMLPDFGVNNHEHTLKAMESAFLILNSLMESHSETWKAEPVQGLPAAGTTATCIFLTSDHLLIANVGDSPVFLVKNQDGKLCTELAVSLHIPIPNTPEAYRVRRAGGIIYRRSKSVALVKSPLQNGYLSMTRALGDFWCCHPNIQAPIISPNPSCRSIPLDNDLVGIIVASDGIKLKERRITKIVNSFKKDSLANPAEKLIKEMYNLKPKGLDNISVIYIALNRESKASNKDIVKLESDPTQDELNLLFSQNNEVIVENEAISYRKTKAECFKRGPQA